MTPTVTERLAGPRVAVDDRLLTRLQAICAVDTDPEQRSSHSRDWWPLAMHWALSGQTPALPAVVVRPVDAAQVAAVLATCSEAAVPVTPTAGRSGVCGASVPVFGGVALDMGGLAGVVDVDDTSLLVEVRPGTFGPALETTLGDRGLTLGHWPQSMAISTVGGWLACRSAGQYSTRYGTIADMVAGLEVALADGRVVRTGGRSPRSATGPDLTHLFVGSEGTLGVVTSALLRVAPRPPAERRAAFGFGSFADGLHACRRILRRGATPAVLRLYDEVESRRDFAMDDGSCVLIVLDEADPWLADAVARVVAEECAAAEPLDDDLVARWLARRNDVSALAALVSAGVVVDTCEVAARWSGLAEVHRGCMAALAGLPGLLAASAHQSHAYPDGACVYVTFAGRPPGEGPPEPWYVSAWDAVMHATIAAGGTISHHHGVGLNRARFLPAALGPAFDTLVAIKQALDPAGVLNPGKLGLPSPWGNPAWP